MVKLILYECRKHFFKKPLAAIFILFLVLNTLKIGNVYNENSLLAQRHFPGWKTLYMEQYDRFGGVITTEKIRQLMDIYSPLESQTADLTASTATDRPDTFTGNIYSDYFFFRDCFVRPMEYDYMYGDNAADIAAAARANIDFYETVGNSYEAAKNAAIARLYTGRSIHSFARTEMFQYYLQYDFSTLPCLLICLYGLMNVFVLEKETGMDMVLLTARLGGARTTTAKIAASVLFVAAVGIIFQVADLAAFQWFFGGPWGGSLPLYALRNYEYAAVGMSLLWFTLLAAAAKLMGLITAALGFLAVSCTFKNALLPFLINLSAAVGLLVMAQLWAGSGHILLKMANPMILFDNHALFGKTEFINILGRPVPGYVMAIAAALLWGLTAISIIFACTRKNTVLRRGPGRARQ